MPDGYTRQSASDIVNNGLIQAVDFNNEFNALQSAFDASVGHTHDGTTGGGAQITSANSLASTAFSGLLGYNNAWTGTNTFTTQSTSDNSTKVATTAFVQANVAAVSAGLNFKNAVSVATTANLTATYVNGVLGVGATLTNSGAQAQFTLDGQTPATNARVLVKNQSTSYQNGIYTLTTQGSNSTNWVLTRSTDYDVAPSQIYPGNVVPVDTGTVNASSGWLMTATVNTIGTDAISFSEYIYPATSFFQVANNLSEGTAATMRTNLGLGTAAVVATGTSGATIPLMNGNNTWSGTNAFGIITATSLALGGASIGSNGLAVTGHVLIEGVTSTGATGTGNFVFSASPTLSGTVTGPDSGTWASGGINSSIIGATTAAAGTFTTLKATTSNVTTLGSTSAVAYGFNSAKTGFYSASQDAQLQVVVNGTTIGTWFSNELFMSNIINMNNNALYMNGSATQLTTPASATLHLGAVDAASPVAQTLGVQGVVAGTSNTAGTNFTINMSQGTGTGAGGGLIFQYAAAGSTGSSQNALANVGDFSVTTANTWTFANAAKFSSTLSVSGNINLNGSSSIGNATTIIATANSNSPLALSTPNTSSTVNANNITLTAGNNTNAGNYAGGSIKLTPGSSSNGTAGSTYIYAAGTTTAILTASTGVQIGAPTGGDQGAGTINATGLFINGVAAITSSGIGKVSMQAFASSGTYTPTSGTKYAVVYGWGGGGSPANSGAGGGGGGELAIITLTAAQIGASKAVVIGAGGSNSAGGNTTFGSTLLIAVGGSQGSGSTGGAGGTGGTGTVLINGQAGGSATSFTDGSSQVNITGGYGGGSPMMSPNIYLTVAQAGINGTLPGQGGTGDIAGTNSVVGFKGYMYIVEYQ